jgi:hypothetical protein
MTGMALAVPVSGHACSKIGFHPLRSAGLAHFIATPTADTVRAGVGNVPSRSALVSREAHENRVYGQVMSVERVGGLAAQALAAPLRRVVLVPWDYREDCETSAWTSGATWAQPGTRGLFTAILRDSAHWARGIPTFDVFDPYHQPYPHRSGRIRASDSLVPIDELFQLMELFPEEQQLRDAPEAATARLFAWARENPAAARRYPIRLALSSARYAFASHWLRSIQSPMIGTYRFTVALTGNPTRTFFARTRRAPISAWDYRLALEGPRDDPTFVRRPDGYTLLASVGSSVRELPRRCDDARIDRREGYLAVVDSAPLSRAGRRSWPGVLEVSLVERAFPGDSALVRVATAVEEEYFRRARTGLPALTPARFTEAADGTMSVEQQVRLDDGRTLFLRGTRISPEVIACPWP